MPKNIVICSDGTGNAGIKDRGTNVFKLFEAVDLNGHRGYPGLGEQIAFYDDGVGTESLLPLKLLGGAFGWGLARNVRYLYMALVRVYDPGDRIFVFGFSRGAFTVRTLVGMIARCGVLDRRKLVTTDDLRAAVSEAYRTYRRSYRTWLGRRAQAIREKLGGVSDAQAMADFKARHSLTEADFAAVRSPLHEVRIAFVGVWDTVDSVGGPFHISDVINTVFFRFKFPDHRLSPIVGHAAHALSIDDARAAFEPRLWQGDPRIEQVWFAGVHSNVGGGYPKQGMSLVTLDWMLRKALQHNLRIVPSDLQFYSEHGSVDDKLYDSRAGLGVFYQWKPRDMQALCERQGAALPPVVHLSVIDRIAHGTDGYSPGTLAPAVDVAYTDSGAAPRAATAGAVLNAALATSPDSFRKVRATLWIGSMSYWIYVLSCLAVVVAAGILKSGGQKLNPWMVVKNTGGLILDALTGKWTELWPTAVQMVRDSPLLLALLLGFAVSGALAAIVDSRRSITFSRFWHSVRERLR